MIRRRLPKPPSLTATEAVDASHRGATKRHLLGLIMFVLWCLVVVAIRVLSPRATTLQQVEKKKQLSACLLVKDENARLPEWLAYHYTVGPLRHLIIAVDKLSVTEPDWILNQWADRLQLNVTVWTDADYYPQSPMRSIIIANGTDSREMRHEAYFQRQLFFVDACLKELKRRGQGWTFMGDVDEYLAFNFPDSGDHHDKNHQNQNHNAVRTNSTNESSTTMPRRLGLPQMTNTTLVDYLKQSGVQWSCDVLPRLLVGPSETSLEEISKDVIPKGFPASELDTMRFRTRARDTAIRPSGKCLVHATKMRTTKIDTPHRVSDECPTVYPDLNHEFRILHYTGTEKEFLLRHGDTHQLPSDPSDPLEWNKQLFRQRSSFPNGLVDDTTQGWLKQFVNQVGHDLAFELLVESKRRAVQEEQLFLMPT